MMLSIGIDPGVHTGFAVYDIEGKEFLEVSTYTLHRAFLRLLEWNTADNDIRLIFEDARLATYSRNNKQSRDQLRGYGSVARDTKVWEEIAIDYEIPYYNTRPNKSLNLFAKNKKIWSLYTGYVGRTSHHARIAASISYKYMSYAKSTKRG